MSMVWPISCYRYLQYDVHCLHTRNLFYGSLIPWKFPSPFLCVCVCVCVWGGGGGRGPVIVFIHVSAWSTCLQI